LTARADLDARMVKIIESYLPFNPDGVALAHAIADDLAEAGFTRPRIVSTVTELEALPVGSVVMGGDYNLYRRTSMKDLFESVDESDVNGPVFESAHTVYWYHYDSTADQSAVTVLFEPTEKETNHG